MVECWSLQRPMDDGRRIACCSVLLVVGDPTLEWRAVRVLVRFGDGTRLKTSVSRRRLELILLDCRGHGGGCDKDSDCLI